MKSCYEPTLPKNISLHMIDFISNKMLTIEHMTMCPWPDGFSVWHLTIFIFCSALCIFFIFLILILKCYAFLKIHGFGPKVLFCSLNFVSLLAIVCNELQENSWLMCLNSEKWS